MDDSKGKSFGDMGLNGLEQFFGGKFPFLTNARLQDFPNVDAFVQNIMNQVMPTVGDFAAGHYAAETFETHSTVIVKINIPDKETARTIRAQANRNQIMLSGVPGIDQKIIKLPDQVRPDSCRAVYKDGIMQFHFRKHKMQDPYYDVNVRFTD